MKNYISINNQKIELTEEQVKRLAEACGLQQKQLSEFAAGSVVNVGGLEFVILEQLDGQTALILKELYCEESEFGSENNNYNGSYADDKCKEFEQRLAEIVGLDNIILHEVDLTSDDGLKDYGKVERRVSILTTAMYRKFVDILDKFNLEKWWWLATAHTTERHGSNRWIRCVSPSGYISCDGYNYDDGGVRPFCILKSSIFVSQ